MKSNWLYKTYLRSFQTQASPPIGNGDRVLEIARAIDTDDNASTVTSDSSFNKNEAKEIFESMFAAFELLVLLLPSSAKFLAILRLKTTLELARTYYSTSLSFKV